MTTTIQTTKNYSTKRLARELGITRSTLISTLRENGVQLNWNEGTTTWEIVSAADAATAVEYFTA